MNSTSRGLLVALLVLVVAAVTLSMRMGIGGLAMFAFWGALIVGGVWLVRTLSDDRTPHARTPLDVLKGRYAAGEITREECEQMRQDLRD